MRPLAQPKPVIVDTAAGTRHRGQGSAVRVLRASVTSVPKNLFLVSIITLDGLEASLTTIFRGVRKMPQWRQGEFESEVFGDADTVFRSIHSGFGDFKIITIMSVSSFDSCSDYICISL